MSNSMIRKTTNQLPKINDDIQSPIIRIYYEFIHLKNLYRQGWLTRGISPEHCESVAEHSFGVAITALILAESFIPKLDILKVMKMALIHDFGEIYAGDIIPTHNISIDKKHLVERESILRVFASFPDREKYIAVWDEFELGESLEAKFVRQIDKLEMAMQASVYHHLEEMNVDEFFQSASRGITSPELRKILEELKRL